MKVLIVDDELNIRTSLSQFFSVYDIDSELAENGLVAQRLLLSDSFDAMVVDLKMPGMDGLELIEWMRDQFYDIPVIMVSAHGEITDAVTALKVGAADYIVKPFDPQELVDKIIKMVEAHQVNHLVTDEIVDDISFIGSTPEMITIKKDITKYAKTKSTILITGESGTGKNVIAKEIHKLSFGEDGPFQAINIGGVQANLIESELFGHEKGAFTGAIAQKKGLFELASGGTLFLDELGDLSLELQVKLLTVLQDKQIQRLGSTKKIDIDVRIIAATNKDLEKMAFEENTFRQDLFYRLNVLRIKIPPLRDRLEDIPALAAQILKKKKHNIGKDFIEGFSPNAIMKLKSASYFGNIRELENVLERAIIYSEDELIHEDDIRFEENSKYNIVAQTTSHKSNSEFKSLKEMEREQIIESLHRWAGNKTKAAEELGISRRTLINKINDYEIAEFKKTK